MEYNFALDDLKIREGEDNELKYGLTI